MTSWYSWDYGFTRNVIDFFGKKYSQQKSIPNFVTIVSDVSYTHETKIDTFSIKPMIEWELITILYTKIFRRKIDFRYFSRHASHSGPENLKKSRPKKLVKSNKSISRKFFLIKFHFLQFQTWPKINFWTGKKIKTARNAISRKKECWYFLLR